MDVFLVLVVRRSDSVQGGFTVASKLVEFCKVFRLMLLEVKKSGWITFDISVAEVVECIIKSIFDILLEFWRIMLSVLVKFARCRLQFVSLGRFTTTLRNELIDATLYCRSGQVLLIKKERHQAHQSLLRG